VIAVGEIGLDYQGLPKDETKSAAIKQKQIDIFKKQLAFAREFELPVIIHSRMAHEDLINILRGEQKQGSVNGAIHCFTGTVEQMKEYYGLGLYFGLNGIIFKLDLSEAIKQMPLERILLETDCPFLSPPNMPQRNVPQNTELIAQRVAQIRGDSVENIIEAATLNSQKLFKI
jgi:TatD DNase family protein